MAQTNTSETQINYDVQSQDERSESEISPEEKPEKEIKNEASFNSDLASFNSDFSRSHRAFFAFNNRR